MKTYRIGSIYVITNGATGKQYVGKCFVVNKRWAAHVHDAAKGADTYLHRAIRKHGVDRFTIKVVHQCTAPLLNSAERHYIAKLGTLVPGGYNLTKGGDGGGYGHRTKKERKVIGAKIGAANHASGRMAVSKIAFYETPEGEACKARISAKLTGRKLSKKERRHHSEALYRRYEREEERIKTGIASRKFFASFTGLRVRQDHSKAMLKRAADGPYFTADTHKLLSDIAKAQWAERRARGQNNRYTKIGRCRDLVRD